MPGAPPGPPLAGQLIVVAERASISLAITAPSDQRRSGQRFSVKTQR
jgi:hypothetical protein